MPTGKTYRLSTLQDVFNLETPEQIALAMSELSAGMVMLKKIAAAVGPSLINPTWQEFTDWKDDGKGEITPRVTISLPPVRINDASMAEDES